MNKKKLIVLLSIVVLFMTGCSVKKLSSYDLGSNVKYLLSSKSKTCNVYFDGYKYYVPKGMNFLYKEDYNATLVDKMGNKFNTKVDSVSLKLIAKIHIHLTL